MRIAKTSSIILLSASILGLVAGASSPSTHPSSGAEQEVRQALTVFLTAFDQLDWPAFRACFAADATMFHPALPNLKRIDSPPEFEKAWLGVFARIKKNSGRDSPPYMDLHPQDLKIQILSPDIALVSFHLTEANVLSRRTVVFRHDAGGWKIVHLHASNLALPPH